MNEDWKQKMWEAKSLGCFLENYSQIRYEEITELLKKKNSCMQHATMIANNTGMTPKRNGTPLNNSFCMYAWYVYTFYC